jgi:hypothetical protein
MLEYFTCFRVRCVINRSLRHAIHAAKIAAIGYRKAQIGYGARKLIDKGA